MIRIFYDPRIPRVSLRGHAGTDVKGRDLVCASVTALALTLRENGRGILRPGYGEITGDPGDRAAFGAICKGFRLLSAWYPQAVGYRVAGDREKAPGLVK